MAWETAGKVAEHLSIQSALTAKMEANGLEASRAKASSESLRGKLNALEAGMQGRLKRLEAEKDGERKALETKIAHLQRQVQALKASKSVRRSYLYWSGMLSTRSPEQTHRTIDSMGLADPEGWRKPPLPGEVFR